MKHTHQVTSSKTIPGIVTIHFCTCGARKRSDSKPVAGAVLSADGWYVAQPRDLKQEAIDRIVNEGYTEPREPRDMRDEFDGGAE
jgi:hypothetical protein